MFSRPLAFILLVLGCVTAAAGGAYIATRHNASDVTATAPAPAPSAASAAVPAGGAAPAATAQPVAETEAAVSSPKAPAAAPAPDVHETAPAPAVTAKRSDPRTPKPTQKAQDTRRTQGHAPVASAPAAPTPSPQFPPAATTPPPPAAAEPVKPLEAQPEAPRAPQFEEVILPASSVISLQLESSLSSERARVEDRVDARVTRDVIAAGRVAIPAGSRVLGSVTVVDRGGKMKDRARLGVRFHTLILADGSEVPLHTDAVYREGESPAGGSTKKIGGAAVGGAILGAILGGGKGAAIGGATGAAGGTAAVMAGDRSAATLSRGEVVTPKLSAPATITVERRE
jgi:hypothetical protein